MKTLFLTIFASALALTLCSTAEAAQKPKASKAAATKAAATKAATKTAPKAAEPEEPVTAANIFKAPKGAKAAIVVFEDLQCPMCSKAAPQVEKAGATYKIPVIRHDFPLPKHDWSLQAAIIARYFDQTSKDLGNQFRDYMFQNQTQINPDNLRAYADTFAGAHKISLPFVVDPQGKLAALVAHDKSLGEQIRIDHTPTIYVVSAKPGVQPMEVPSGLDQLYSMIDTALKQ